jgi:hypothetical protein
MTANGKPALAATLKAAILQAEIASARAHYFASLLSRHMALHKAVGGFLWPEQQELLRETRAALADEKAEGRL